MLILKTNFGDFLLHNAVRIDFYRVQESDKWVIYCTIDAYKNKLYCFEEPSDADFFCTTIRTQVIDLLCENDRHVWNLNHLCDDVVDRVINRNPYKALYGKA